MKHRIYAWVALALISFASGSAAKPIQNDGTGGRRSVMAELPSTCRDIIPEARAGSETRSVRPGDLLALRDFGSNAVMESLAPGFALSPDGALLAVQVRRAVPTANAYCQALLLFDLRSPSSPPMILDAGGELIRDIVEIYGLKRFPTGMASALTPKWSRDGRWIAFMRRDQGETRLHVVSPATGRSRSLSRIGADVTDFDWDSRQSFLTIDFVAHDSPEQERTREEGRSGYRYDTRFWMLATTEPLEEQTLEESRFRLDLSQTTNWRDTPLESASDLSADIGEAADEVRIDTDPSPAGAYRSRVRAKVGGQTVHCKVDVCADVTAAWMQQGSNLVVYLRRQGYANATIGIYVWQPGVNHPRQIAETEDAFTGCQLETQLICGRETSLRPRDIVEIDLRSGAMRPLVNLNPEWSSLKLGEVTRLRWVNRFGIESIGDLAMPPDAKPYEQRPLVIVQYNTRGFLRGGVGDEYPIQAIAATGFAVLSISRPIDYGVAMARAGKSVAQRKIVDMRLDRASAHDSLLQGIAQAKLKAAIDSERIAITGLSDGASTATYALINSNVFSLALLSTCCEDPQITMTSIGPRYERWMNERGYVFQLSGDKLGWKRASLAMNAAQICSRIVIQAADREARMALASFTSLKRAGVDVEMFVFPDEYHIKWQPVHRDAVYRRTLSELARWAASPPTKCDARR